MTVAIEGMDSVRRALDRLPGDLQDKAAAMAINKVAAKANTEINRAIRDEFVIPADEVRNAISIAKASAKRPGEVSATISIFGSAKKKGRSLNLIHFLAAVQAAGRAVKVRGSPAKKQQLAALEKQIGFAIKRGGGLKSIPGAFIGNHGRTVFIRTGDKRLPIKPLQVIGVSQMFSSKRISRRVMDRIDRELPVEMDRAVNLVLERFGK